MTDIDYWSDYYKKKFKKEKPSLFARWVLDNYVKNGNLLELGCGNGRDSMYFANAGINVHSFDQCEFVINELNNMKIPFAKFETGDFTKLSLAQKYTHIYSRFTLHSINKEEATRTLNFAFDSLKSNGNLYIEVRGIHDELFGVGKEVEKDAWFTDHYRRFVRLEELTQELKQIGFEIVSAKEETGYAPFGSSDPKVIRLVASKTS